MPDFEIEFEDGPFAGRRGIVSTRYQIPPMFLYVLPSGDFVSTDAISDNDPAAHQLSRRAHLYQSRPLMTARRPAVRTYWYSLAPSVGGPAAGEPGHDPGERQHPAAQDETEQSPGGQVDERL